MAKAKQPVIPAEFVAARMKPLTWSYTEAKRAETLSGLLDGFRPALLAAFDAVNGRAGSFTLSTSDAINLAVETEERLAEMGVPKASRPGTVVTMSSAGPSASAYKYTATGTEFALRRNTKGDWLVERVARITVYPKQSSRTRLVVSQDARDAIVRRALDGIDTHPQPAAIAA